MDDVAKIVPFFQVWLSWTWTPTTCRTAAGFSFGWGPFLVGYLRLPRATPIADLEKQP